MTTPIHSIAFSKSPNRVRSLAFRLLCGAGWLFAASPAVQALDLDFPRYSITFENDWTQGDESLIPDSLGEAADNENGTVLLKGSGLGGIAYITGVESESTPDPADLESGLALFGGGNMTEVASGEERLGDYDVMWIEYEYTDLEVGDGSDLPIPSSGSYRLYATKTDGYYVTVVATTFLPTGTKPYPSVETALATLKIKDAASIRPTLRASRFAPGKARLISLDGRSREGRVGTGPILQGFVGR